MARFNRYALYYRLLDIALACQTLIIAAAAFKRWTGESAVDGVLRYPFAVVFMIGVFLPTLLIFQRWMRDDFSEMLWQRTAGTVLKLLVVLPLPLIIVIGIPLAVDSATTEPLRPVLDGASQRDGLFQGFVRSMLLLWLVTPALFTFAFQWHRWRASR